MKEREWGGAEQAPREETQERGTALMVVLFVILLLMGLAVMATQTTVIRSRAAIENTSAVWAFNAAEAGLGIRLRLIGQSNGTDLGTDQGNGTYTTNLSLPKGTVLVTVTDTGTNNVDDDGDGSTDEADEQGVLKFVSRATTNAKVGANGQPITRAVEAYLRQTFHPLFYKAVYVGNKTNDANYLLGLGPSAGSPRAPANDNPQKSSDPATDYPGSSWENWENNADYIEGDVHVNADIHITGQSNIYGQVDATGAITGKPVNGSTNEGVNPINPPDLAAQDYDNIADKIVTWDGNAGDTSNITNFLADWPVNYPSGNSAYHYQKYPANFTRNNFHFGRSSSTMSITQTESGKLYVIKGNLWLDTRGVTEFKFPNTSDGRQITIVVEGNVYIADGLSYTNALDGLLIIAKANDTNPESYVDTNMNGVRDAGEAIINDDGDNVYEGPKEGQGNIFYGDLVASKGGITDGYFYAQNNVYLAPTQQTKQAYGVKGFLNAGGETLLGRQGMNGNRYPSYRVKYDPRLANGQLTGLKGIPKGMGGGWAGIVAVAWRQIP